MSAKTHLEGGVANRVEETWGAALRCARWLVALGAWLVVVPAFAAGVVVRDDLQREISLGGAPQRVISMMPSLTETVCALGACERLVATDRYSNWPASVRALPKTGGLDDAAIELIVSLKPDLVLMSSSQRITARLQELGIVSFTLNTQSYADSLHAIAAIAQLLGVPERAPPLVAAISRDVDEVAAQALARRRGAGPSVYFEVDHTPYAAGPASFIGEMLQRLGARNIVGAELGAFPRLNPEYVVRHDPDVIFVEQADIQGLSSRPGWSAIRAIRERRVCAILPEVADTVVRAGPRIAAGMRALDECLTRVAP